MKKILLCAVLGLALLTVTACANTAPATTDQPSFETKQINTTVDQSEQTDPILEQTEPTPQNTVNPATVQPVSDGFLYENEDHGFSLTLPQTWQTYNWHRRTVSYDDIGTMQFIQFGFEEQEELFRIAIYTQEQWQTLMKEADGSVPSLLAENEEFVFAYDHAQDTVSPSLAERMREVPDIIKTFSLK